MNIHQINTRLLKVEEQLEQLMKVHDAKKKVSVLKSEGVTPKRVSKEPGDREE